MTTMARLVQTNPDLDEGQLHIWIEHGWVRPDYTAEGPDFQAVDIARVRLILELRNDLAIGEDAIPVVLGLLDQLYGLRHRLITIAQAIEAQPEGTKSALLASMRAAISASSHP